MLTLGPFGIQGDPSAHADRGKRAGVRVAGSEGGVPITRQTWFAEVGPLREVGHGRTPSPLDNSPPSAAGRSRTGPKGAGSFRSSAVPSAPPSASPRTLRYRGAVLLRMLLALAAGVSLTLAFEPRTWWFLIPFSVAGFTLTTRGLTAPRAAVVGLAFGVGFFFTHVYWMRAVGTDAWLALASVESLFYGVLGAVFALLGRRRRFWPLWLTAAWVAMESIRSSWPFSGMPWGRLAFATIDTPLQTALPYVGSTGVSLRARAGRGPGRRAGDRPPPAPGRARVVGRARRSGAAVAPWCRTPRPRVGRPPWRRSRATCPGAGDDILHELPAGHGQSGRCHRRAGRRCGRRPGASTRLRGLAGELHGRRPLRRRGDQPWHRDCFRRHWRPDPGRCHRRQRAHQGAQPGHRLGA